MKKQYYLSMFFCLSLFSFSVYAEIATTQNINEQNLNQKIQKLKNIEEQSIDNHVTGTNANKLDQIDGYVNPPATSPDKNLDNIRKLVPKENELKKQEKILETATSSKIDNLSDSTTAISQSYQQNIPENVNNKEFDQTKDVNADNGFKDLLKDSNIDDKDISGIQQQTNAINSNQIQNQPNIRKISDGYVDSSSNNDAVTDASIDHLQNELDNTN